MQYRIAIQEVLKATNSDGKALKFLGESKTFRIESSHELEELFNKIKSKIQNEQL